MSKKETFYESLVRLAYEPETVWIERLKKAFSPDLEKKKPKSPILRIVK